MAFFSKNQNINFQDVERHIHQMSVITGKRYRAATNIRSLIGYANADDVKFDPKLDIETSKNIEGTFLSGVMQFIHITH